jgi:hypothetical protein
MVTPAKDQIRPNIPIRVVELSLYYAGHLKS